MDKPLLFGTSTYGHLVTDMLKSGYFEPGQHKVSPYPDGERGQIVASDVDGRRVVVVAGTGTDSEFLEFCDLSWTLADLGAASLTMVLAYVGNMTMERRTKPGEAVTGVIRARMIGNIKRASGGNRVMPLELHAEGAENLFGDNVISTPLSTHELVMREALLIGGPDKRFVLGGTDSGRNKVIDRMSKKLNVPTATIGKRRVNGTETEVTGVSADVKGLEVVVYDDMIRTGSSLLGAAETYLKLGATGVHAIATHGVLPGGSLKKLKDSGFLKSCRVTNSHPHAVELANEYPGWFKVMSIADLLVKNIASVLHLPSPNVES